MHRTHALKVVPLLAIFLAGCPNTQSSSAPPPPMTVQHQASIRWMPASVNRFRPLIEQASFRHGVDANLLAVMILVESGGDPLASSPKGAMGLMQIMPATGQEIARERGIVAHVDARLYDPSYNIDFGAYYLAKQIDRFRTRDPRLTIERAAGAYNGGGARMARHLERGETLPAETMRYKRWVTGMWIDRHAPQSPMYREWYAAGGGRLVARSNNPLPIL